MYHSVTAISPITVFVFGGRVSPARPLLTYGVYELKDDRLCPVETFTLSSLDCEPAPRWRHRAVKCGGLWCCFFIKILGGWLGFQLTRSYGVFYRLSNFGGCPDAGFSCSTHILDISGYKKLAYNKFWDIGFLNIFQQNVSESWIFKSCLNFLLTDSILICGGRGIGNKIYNDIWCFNLTSKQWKMVRRYKFIVD